jgi:hypothetical protein
MTLVKIPQLQFLLSYAKVTVIATQTVQKVFFALNDQVLAKFLGALELGHLGGIIVLSVNQ